MIAAECVAIAQKIAWETYAISKLTGIGLITFGLFIGYYIRSKE